MAGKIPFPELSPRQKRWWYTDKPNICAVGGRRQGKSMLGRLYGTKTAAEGGLVLWVSGDSNLAEDSWKDLTSFLEPHASRFAPTGKGVVTLQGGGEIRRVSAANVNSGRGPTPAMIVVDECQTVPSGFFLRALPSLAVNGGRMILMGTPPDSPIQVRQAQWLRDMLDNPGNYEDWLIDGGPTLPEDIAFMLSKNLPGGDKMTWEQLLERAKRVLAVKRKELGDLNFEREFNAKWIIRTEGRVLDGYTPENISDSFDYDPREGDVYWGFDRGEGKAATVCLFCQVMLSKPGIRVFGERYTMDIVDEGDWIERCIQYSESMKWPMPKMGIYDVRAPRYRMALWEHNIPAFGRSRIVNEGVNLLNSGFRKGWVNYHSRCTRLETEMHDWRYKASKNGKSAGEPSDSYRDGADTLRYLYEYLIDHYGAHWRKQVKEADLQSLQRISRDTVFTFSWV